MSAAEVIAQIADLPVAERVEVVEGIIRHMSPDQLKRFDRFIRRLTHPDVPEEIWEGYEDYEDGRFVDAETILSEQNGVGFVSMETVVKEEPPGE
ncbi:MAG: DUF4299 domain-containing protein [Verrucomicrobia bacterium]|jgi:hypothetical protein|nr:MAG: DUF4299 domain-containing protein [Verrucomicrobiota bacterium]